MHVEDHADETIKARLTIDTTGNPREVAVSGSSASVRDSIKRTILQWKFKPTVLDGRPRLVSTEFTSLVDRLTKVAD